MMLRTWGSGLSSPWTAWGVRRGMGDALLRGGKSSAD